MSDGPGWLYALELAPSGWVKVGHTGNLTGRLATHATSAAFGGATVVRVAAALTVGSAARERDLIQAVAALPRATLAHGRETFAGVAFTEVAGLVQQLAEQTIPVRVVAPQHEPTVAVITAVPELLDDVAKVMDYWGAAGMSLRDLLDALQLYLNPRYRAWDIRALGTMLRSAGVEPRTVRVSSTETAQGVVRGDLPAPVSSSVRPKK